MTPDYPSFRIAVFGDPLGKPRMTRSDKWKKRATVLRYWAWAQSVRKEAYRTEADLKSTKPTIVHLKAYFERPKSWSKKKKAASKGKPHTSKPDADNIAKAALDALYPDEDKHVFAVSISKYWDDGHGPRLVITVSEATP